MPNALLIEKATKILKNNFKNFDAIQSAYLYGSILTDNFHKESDIDVLFIVDDSTDRNKFLKKLRLHAPKKNISD